MDAPHDGGQLQGLPHYGPDGVGVHPSHEGRDEDDAETRLAAIPDGLELPVQERSSPQGAVDLIIDPVELEKDRRETRGPEPSCVVDVRGEAEAVRIDLDEGIADPSRDFDDLRKVVPQGGLTPDNWRLHGPAAAMARSSSHEMSSSGGSSASPGRNRQNRRRNAGCTGPSPRAKPNREAVRGRHRGRSRKDSPHRRSRSRGRDGRAPSVSAIRPWTARRAI